MIKHATLGAEEETKMIDVNADLLAALKETTLCLEAVLITVDLTIGSPEVPGEGRVRTEEALVAAQAAIAVAERDESADAEREQARAEHLGELAAEREMVQAQTPVVNVEAAIRLGEEAE